MYNSKSKANIMKKKYHVIANWKMNYSFKESLDFIAANYDRLIKLSQKENISLVICPSFTTVFPIYNMFKDTKIGVGGQDCSNHSKGSFTGQETAKSLHEIGCQYCIIGHSERRKYNHETNKEIGQKFIHLIDFDISPIICIGESLEEHKTGKTIPVIEKQLEAILGFFPTISIPKYLSPCIAYEPIWSIGTDKTPQKEHLENVFAWLSRKATSTTPTSPFRLLYGGSINKNNIKQFSSIENINGFLLGGSSLHIEQLQQIIAQLN